MKELFKHALVLLVLFFLSTEAQAAKWQFLRNGIAYQVMSFTNTPQETFKLHIFKIDPKQYRFKPVLSPSGTRQTVSSFADSHNALIAVNSNFFDIEHKPLGLVIQNGKTLNPFKKISWWGVFYIKKSRPFIVHSSDYHPDSGIESAVEAGPRLVINGRVAPLKEEISAKTVIGIDAEGQVILAITQHPINIRELASFMAKPKSQGGLECINALNFDGGSSTQLFARFSLFELNLSGISGVPAALTVVKK